MSPSPRFAPSTLLRIGPPIAVLIGAMLLLPIPDIRGSRSTQGLAFGAIGPIAAVLDLATGQALLVAGAMAWLLGVRRRVGLLSVLAGVAWFGPDLFALEQAEPVVRAIGRFALVPLLPALLLHLAMAVSGLDDRRRGRILLVAAYLGTAIVAVGTAITYKAFQDGHCLDCVWSNPLLVASGLGSPRIWRLAAAALVIGMGAALVAVGWSELQVSRPWRHPRGVVATGAVGVGAATLLRGVLLVLAPQESFLDPPWAAWALILIGGTLLLGAGVAAVAVATWRWTERMRRIVDSLEAAPRPGTLEMALARALGDPTLRIAYTLDPGGMVDATGAPIEPKATSGRSLTPLERAGRRIAVVEHGSQVERSALAEAFGPTLLVALDNERLRAARLAQLAELRASRARIVAVGDAERRRLERDLHDGVQQQLLSILFDLRRARLAAERGGDVGRGPQLAVAEGRAQAMIDELRRVAHGIHPAVLSRSGLGPALASLAEDSPLPVEVAADGVGRLPEAVEAAAYQVVAETVGVAAADGAEALTVTVAVGGGMLKVGVTREPSAGGATSGAEVPVRIEDRVGAAGGTVIVEALPTGGTLLRVELPCA